MANIIYHRTLLCFSVARGVFMDVNVAAGGTVERRAEGTAEVRVGSPGGVRGPRSRE